MKRSRSYQADGPFTAYRCTGSATVYVLMSDAVPEGSLLDLMRRTGMDVTRDPCRDGGAIVLDGIDDDVARVLFGFLGDFRRVQFPRVDDPTFGERLREAADYLQLPPSIRRHFRNITTSGLPHNTTLQFPYCRNDECLGAPRRATFRCRIRRFQHEDASNLCMVSFFGNKTTYDCVYRIEYQRNSVYDVEDAVIAALANSTSEQTMHDTVVYLMHACDNTNPCGIERGLFPDSATMCHQDNLACIELAYDHFGRIEPTIRLYEQPRVFGREIPVPTWCVRE